MIIHPVDHFNLYGTFNDIFSNMRDVNLITPSEAAILPNLNTPAFICNGTTVKVKSENPYGFAKDSTISKFMLLSAVKFKSNNMQATSWITSELMGETIPYIRVGTDYFKVIKKRDRFGVIQIELRPWMKQTIIDDNGKNYLSKIPMFDSFIIDPDNLNHNQVVDNCYNLYNPFAHTPHDSPVTESDIPVTINFMRHIFSGMDSDHFNQGLTYMKCLYEHPKQILPILALISKKRDTGKTTFNNWLTMIFGSNFISVEPEILMRAFNSGYAYKNIISFEEAFVEKTSAIEKLKHLSTSKMIDVRQKFVNDYSIPFFGKFILYTNKVLDFMKIDSEEIRFWVRPIPEIKGKKNVLIEQQLLAEIPKFLRYLKDLPPIAFDTGSRMLFTKEQIQTEALGAIMNESKSWLHKELEIHIEDFYSKNPKTQLLATAVDIKKYWYVHNHQVNIPYIRRVLTQEMGMKPSERKQRYYPMGETDYQHTKVGYPFVFENPDPSEPMDNIPFGASLADAPF